MGLMLMSVLVPGLVIYVFFIQPGSSWLPHLLWVVLAIPLLLLVYFFSSSSFRCPLCRVTCMAANRCGKHRKARPLFGSYRMRVAMGIVFSGDFRCPYCGEPVALQQRTSRRW